MLKKSVGMLWAGLVVIPVIITLIRLAIGFDF